MPEQQFQVKTSEFEGSLELLLTFIEKRKLFINDISLAQIADDYVQFLNNQSNFALKDVSNFILIASTLILIKSKSLLPHLSLTLEEEESIEDLEDRLKEYRLIKSLSKHLEKRFGLNIIFNSPSVKVDPVFTPDETISNKSLLQSARNVIDTFPKEETQKNPKGTIKKVISLEEMINDLSERIQSSLKLTFKDFTNTRSKGQKIHMIVSFLAVLELFKTGLINLRQEKNFSDIHIENQNLSVPTYNT